MKNNANTSLQSGEDWKARNRAKSESEQYMNGPHSRNATYTSLTEEKMGHNI